MAQITVKVLGGELKELNASTIGEVKTKLNLTNVTATVNGCPEDDDYQLEDFEFVALAPAVKGGK